MIFKLAYRQGFSQQLWKQAPGQILEKMIDLTSKLGEINGVEHNKASKIWYYAQSIPLEYKCLQFPSLYNQNKFQFPSSSLIESKKQQQVNMTRKCHNHIYQTQPLAPLEMSQKCI